MEVPSVIVLVPLRCSDDDLPLYVTVQTRLRFAHGSCGYSMCSYYILIDNLLWVGWFRLLLSVCGVSSKS